MDPKINIDAFVHIDKNISHEEDSEETKSFLGTKKKPRNSLTTIIPALNNNSDFRKSSDTFDKEPLRRSEGSSDSDIESNTMGSNGNVKVDEESQGQNSKDNNCVVEGDGKKPKHVRTGCGRYIGIMLGLASAMMFPLGALIVKALPQYHPYNVTFWRFQGILHPAIVLSIYHRCVKKQHIFDSIWPITAQGRGKTAVLLWLRGIFGATAVVLQFAALQYISMADSFVIAFSTPVFVTLVAHLFLGEKCGVIPIVSGILTLVGVVVISRPPLITGAEEFDTNNLIGASLAFCCMFCATATFILLRYLRQLHYSMFTLFFGIWGSFQSAMLAVTFATFQLPQTPHDWMLALGLAALTFVGQMCMTLAFKFEQASTISLTRTTDTIFAFIWQFLFLGVVPDIYSSIGASVVILGILLVGFRKWVGELSPEDKTRQRLSWILK